MAMIDIEWWALHGAVDRHQTVSIEAAWSSLACQIFIRSRSPSDNREDSWKKSTIVAPSSQNHLHDHQTAFIGESRSRSTHDRGPIAARSWCDRGSFEVKSWLIQRQSGSHDQCQGNHSHDALNSPPRPHQLATIFGRNFPLKACISLLISLTFDRFVK